MSCTTETISHGLPDGKAVSIFFKETLEFTQFPVNYSNSLFSTKNNSKIKFVRNEIIFIDTKSQKNIKI